MKTIMTACGAILIAVSMSSCYAPQTKNGAVIGGLIGAGTGALIGNQSCRPLEGAAIGGAVGALGGALIGSAQDDRASGYHHGGIPDYGPGPGSGNSGGYNSGYDKGGYSGGYRGGYDKGGGYGYNHSPPPPPSRDPYRSSGGDYRY